LYSQVGWLTVGGCEDPRIKCDLIGNTTHVTSLDLNQMKNFGSSDLQYLVYFPFLRNLILSGNDLSDGSLDPLKTAVNLVKLEARDCQLTGTLAALTNATGLAELLLDGNKLTGDLSGLSGKPALQTALLQGGNAFTGTLEPLSSSPNLVLLVLSGSAGITGTLRPLRGAASLAQIYLDGLSLEGTLAPLRGKASLTHVDISGSNITGTLDALSSASALIVINVANTQLTGTLDGLAAATGLQYLIAPNNKFTGTLAPLAGHAGLIVVDLIGSNLTGDLVPLQDSTALFVVNLDQNSITGDLAPLSGAAGLSELRLANNGITGDTTLLNGLRRLARLDLTGNPVDPCALTPSCGPGICDRGNCICDAGYKGIQCESVIHPILDLELNGQVTAALEDKATTDAALVYFCRMVAIALTGAAVPPEAPPLLTCVLIVNTEVEKSEATTAFMRATPISGATETMMVLPGEEQFSAVAEAMAQYFSFALEIRVQAKALEVIHQRHIHTYMRVLS
jgi:Leucine-rich repeat (LRR) protein